MSNPGLPQETIDYIIDSSATTLRHSKFDSIDGLKKWKKAFPDPSNSPALYAHTLTICCLRGMFGPMLGFGTWSGSFWMLLGLFGWKRNLATSFGYLGYSLTSFYNFSPILRSLRVQGLILPCPELFDLVRSLPLLEDLRLSGEDKSLGGDDDPYEPHMADSSTSPPLTGSLELIITEPGGMRNAARWLLELPNGLHFRKLALSWSRESYFRRMRELVVGCSHTLEHLEVTAYYFYYEAEPIRASIDLSTAAKLKTVAFYPVSLGVRWINLTLRTIRRNNQDLQRVSIYLTCDSGSSARVVLGAIVRDVTGTELCRQWSELDRLLVELWESRSTRAMIVVATAGAEWQDVRDYVGCLLPEGTARGTVDLFGF